MGERESFHYLTSDEFHKLSAEERAKYLERVKEHLLALQEAQTQGADKDRA